MDREDIHDWERADFYAAPDFRSTAEEIFGAGAVEVLDTLLRSSAFPAGPTPSTDLLAHEGVLIMAAMAARIAGIERVADAARAILALEYQLEYGPRGTGDRKGLRDASQPPQKDFFGTELAAAFHRIHELMDRPRRRVRVKPPAVTIGWTWNGDCVASIHYAQREKTLVYSNAYLLRNASEGIVRLDNVQFGFENRFEMSSEDVERFGWLMFAKDRAQSVNLGAGAPGAKNG